MGTIEHGTRLFDMHCHLGFIDDVETVRCCLNENGVHALSCTVLPTEYEQESEALSGLSECTVALGLHPWQITENACAQTEVARFTELVSATRFIGEIGLDYAGERAEPAARELQRDIFAQVLAACDTSSAFPRKLLSLHAVHAATDMLDLLEAHEAFTHHDCVFHWFAGTPEELKRAIDAECYFSVGPRMLATKRGREYARIVPVDRLLLETDSPAHAGEEWSCANWAASLNAALTTIAEVRNVSTEELGRTIAHTSESLLRPA